jgi:glycosyltransferase involved in cell wall biosynthesis
MIVLLSLFTMVTSRICNLSRDDLVSVVIPACGRPGVTEAIRSVLAQSYERFEILVVFDTLPDCSLNGMELPEDVIGDRRVSILSTTYERHFTSVRTASIARNVGIRRAQGTFIAILDDDDLWLPGKLCLQLLDMRKSKSRFSGSEAIYADSTSPLYEWDHSNNWFKLRENHAVWLYNAEVYREQLKRITGIDFELGPPLYISKSQLSVHNNFIASSTMWHTSLMSQCGLFNESMSLAGAEDYDQWLRFSAVEGRMRYLRVPLVVYDSAHAGGSKWVKMEKR